MPTPTYIPLANITFSSATNSVSFTSIPGTYRDLVMTFEGSMSNAGTIAGYFNADASTAHPSVFVVGGAIGAGARSETRAITYFVSPQYYNVPANSRFNFRGEVMDYSVTNKQKAYLFSHSNGPTSVEKSTGRWPSTAAITQVSFVANGNFTVGSTIALYGIAA